MKKVVWSVASKIDLIRIYEYISKDSKKHAKKTVEEIVRSTRYLSRFSYLGKKIFEQDKDCYREILVLQYKVIYRVEKNKVRIITIVHTSRKI